MHNLICTNWSEKHSLCNSKCIAYMHANYQKGSGILFYYNSNFLLICIIDKYGKHAVTNMGHGLNTPQEILVWIVNSEVFLLTNMHCI